MKSREMRVMSNDQLVDHYEDLKEQIYRLRLNESSGELTDTSEFRKARREIARALTVLRERELATELAKEDK